jgi:hypothetical protein
MLIPKADRKKIHELVLLHHGVRAAIDWNFARNRNATMSPSSPLQYRI